MTRITEDTTKAKRCLEPAILEGVFLLITGIIWLVLMKNVLIYCDYVEMVPTPIIVAGYILVLAASIAIGIRYDIGYIARRIIRTIIAAPLGGLMAVIWNFEINAIYRSTFIVTIAVAAMTLLAIIAPSWFTDHGIKISLFGTIAYCISIITACAWVGNGILSSDVFICSIVWFFLIVMFWRLTAKVYEGRVELKKKVHSDVVNELDPVSDN